MSDQRCNEEDKLRNVLVNTTIERWGTGRYLVWQHLDMRR